MKLKGRIAVLRDANDVEDPHVSRGVVEIDDVGCRNVGHVGDAVELLSAVGPDGYPFNLS